MHILQARVPPRAVRDNEELLGCSNEGSFLENAFRTDMGKLTRADGTEGCAIGVNKTSCVQHKYEYVVVTGNCLLSLA